MMGTSYEQALKTLEKTFKDRIRRSSGDTEAKSGALASVLPLHAQEVELLAREAARYSMPLAAVGGSRAWVSPSIPRVPPALLSGAGWRLTG
jgi:hypothetical protein